MTEKAPSLAPLVFRPASPAEIIDANLGRLGETLAKEAARTDCDDLHKAMTQFRCVLQFLANHLEGDTIAPLKALHVALSDLEEGGQPTLLTRPKSSGPRAGHTRLAIHGMLAAALDLLVRHGMALPTGSDWIATRLQKEGLARDEVKAAQIVSWRKKASGHEGPRAAIEVFHDLRKKHEGITTIASAQQRAEEIVGLAYRHWQSSQPARS